MQWLRIIKITNRNKLKKQQTTQHQENSFKNSKSYKIVIEWPSESFLTNVYQCCNSVKNAIIYFTQIKFILHNWDYVTNPLKDYITKRPGPIGQDYLFRFLAYLNIPLMWLCYFGIINTLKLKLKPKNDIWDWHMR